MRGECLGLFARKFPTGTKRRWPAGRGGTGIGDFGRAAVQPKLTMAINAISAMRFTATASRWIAGLSMDLSSIAAYISIGVISWK